LSADVDKLWVKAKECGYVVTPPSSPQVTRKSFDLEKVQRDREEEEECRRALRERDIPPYFDSEVAACFFSKQVHACLSIVCGEFLCSKKFWHIGGILFWYN